MFTGLFLAPWMCMYALSTLVMTHRELVASWYPSKEPVLVTERELDYSRSFATNLTREEIAGQILRDIGLDGTHEVHGGRNGAPLVVDRRHALALQRVTFDPSRNRIVVQREAFRAANFLERMHRRRGYNAYGTENAWGFTVDVAVVTMVFWSLSGIWLWWEIKPNPDTVHIDRFSFRDSISLTYSLKDRKIKAERQPMRWPQVAIRMHFRGGYHQPDFGNKVWGFLVDLACVAILTWVLSGLLMWWRLPRLRSWGALALGAGILSFALLLWKL